MKARAVRQSESGVALITTLMVMMLMSALMVGFFGTIMADQRSSGIDRDQTQAYAAAHAGLEKLTTDLAHLFESDFSPSTAQVNSLLTDPPVIPGFDWHPSSCG
jgi:Tfp pilus assembly protein PilX